jgi:hypothetical protein
VNLRGSLGPLLSAALLHDTANRRLSLRRARAGPGRARHSLARSVQHALRCLHEPSRDCFSCSSALPSGAANEPKARPSHPSAPPTASAPAAAGTSNASAWSARSREVATHWTIVACARAIAPARASASSSASAGCGADNAARAVAANAASSSYAAPMTLSAEGSGGACAAAGRRRVSHSSE